MLRTFCLFVAATCAGMFPTSNIAQPAPPPIPPVISYPVVPPAPGGPGDRIQLKASGIVQTDDGPVTVELLTQRSDAALRLRSSPTAFPQIIPLTKTADVLQLLADKRMAFLWPSLIQWAGLTLEKMRDEQLAKLQAAAAVGISRQRPTGTGESTVRAPTRALLQLATFMIDNGRAADAERLLQQRLSTMPVQANQARWEEIEWMSVAALIASSRAARDDIDGALAEYDLIESTLGSSPYAMNATINRAATLVRRGRYAEALAAVEPLWQQWTSLKSDDKVRGSERQFAWIRACALEGLGRHSEADIAFQPVLDARNTRDRNFVVDSDKRLKLQGLVCMRRTAAVEQLIEDEMHNALFSTGLVTLQPAYRPQRDAEFWKAIRSDPKLAPVIHERMRELPPELVPALNGWRESVQPRS